jgi:hypothetical protein
VSYHERTKHRGEAMPASPGRERILAPRRYAGAPIVCLPPREVENTPQDGEGALGHASASVGLSIDSLSIFLARAEFAATEAYAILPELSDVGQRPALFHYVPVDHCLEQRGELGEGQWNEFRSVLPEFLFLVGLTSIHRQETWKYGERGFRAAQQEVGHALSRLRMAAAALGWRLRLLPAAGDQVLSAVLGLDRDSDFAQAERETPNLMVAVSTNTGEPPKLPLSAFAALLGRLQVLSWQGQANALSSTPGVAWPILDEVTRVTGSAPSEDDRDPAARAPLEAKPHADSNGSGDASALGGPPPPKDETSLDYETFMHLLARLVPTRGADCIPWDAIAWKPRVHLGLLVHRVQGMAPGLYVLCRDPDQLGRLRRALRADALWRRDPHWPKGLDLSLLREGDHRELAARITGVDVSSTDAAFDVVMIADYVDALSSYGASFYRNLLWEAGMVGHLLGSESARSRLRATGGDRYRDELVHQAFGMLDHEWQCLYHFEVLATARAAPVVT